MMHTDVYKALSAAFAKEATPLISGKKRLSAYTLAPEPTVLLNGFPITLNPKDYANPRSTSNPNGDLISLWRFRQLVDPIPMFDTVYLPSSSSLETTYAQIIKGATTDDEDSFASMLISEANKAIATQTFPNMDGTPGNWRPVYAVPDNWYEIKVFDSIKQLSINLSEIERSAASKGKENPLEWKITNADESAHEVPLDPKSKLSSAKVNYQMVSLSRPWFNSMIFETAGWYLKGQNAGFCSSGKNDGNGVIPVVPTSIIIGFDVEIQAEWGDKDMQIISSAKALNQQLSLGPLLVNAGPNDAQIHVIGWVISQIPFSPQISG